MKLIIQGEPIAKARPRMTKTGHAFTPKKTHDAETIVKKAFISSGQTMLDGELIFNIDLYFKIPKSATKGKLLAMQHNTVRPIKRPDIDNVSKLYMDSLNTLAYNDDSQIVTLIANKYYSENPRVEITINEIIGG